MMTRKKWFAMVVMAVAALATTGFASSSYGQKDAQDQASDQQPPPAGPDEKVQAPTQEAKVEEQEAREAAPAEARAVGYVYAGGKKGAWHILGQKSRGIFRDYSNPPRYYANSLTFQGTLANAWWVFKLDGFAGPPQFAIQINSSGDNYRVYYRVNPNSNWVLYDTTGRGAAIGNGQ